MVVDGCGDQLDKMRDRIFPVVEEIDPLPGREFISKSLVWDHIFDPNRNNDQLVLTCEREFLFDLVGVVGIGCKDQHHDLCGADRFDDLFLVVLARLDVA
jgi:hypothetical protein